MSSYLNLELLLENKILTEHDFVRYFGENAFYKEAQCLNLSGSSFHPAWLKYLPNTLKVLKLRRINTKEFIKYGLIDESTMRIEMMKALDGKTLRSLKSLVISDNHIGDEGTHYLVAQLVALISFRFPYNSIGLEVIQELRKLSPRCGILFEDESF